MSKIISVFGATGQQGGGVIRALLAAKAQGKDYTVRALTRDPSNDKGKALQASGCEVAKCDIDDAASVKTALAGSHGVFLVTNFWAHHSMDKEIEQGKSAADICKEIGVKHLVFSGLECIEVGTPVAHFDSKGAVEKYIQGLGVPFTILRMPAYFDNLASPQICPKNPDGTYTITMTMEGKKLHAMGSEDLGECVATVLDKPDEYTGKVIGLSADLLTVDEMAAIVSKHLAPRVFKASPMSAADFMKLPFPGAGEMGAMFEFFQRDIFHRDMDITKKLNPNVRGFDKWVQDHKAIFEKNFPL